MGSNIVQQASDELWIKWKIASTLYVWNDWCVSTDPIHFTIALPGNTLLHYTLPWLFDTKILYQHAELYLTLLYISSYKLRVWGYMQTSSDHDCNKSHLGCEWRVISVPPKVLHPPPPWQTLWPEGSTSEFTSIQPLPHSIITLLSFTVQAINIKLCVWLIIKHIYG